MQNASSRSTNCSPVNLLRVRRLGNIELDTLVIVCEEELLDTEDERVILARLNITNYKWRRGDKTELIELMKPEGNYTEVSSTRLTDAAIKRDRVWRDLCT